MAGTDTSVADAPLREGPGGDSAQSSPVVIVRLPRKALKFEDLRISQAGDRAQDSENNPFKLWQVCLVAAAVLGRWVCTRDRGRRAEGQ